ncbi:MAG TPA: hydantoin racemase [Thermoplasmata archaeon]|nr:hydantoin racemase [Thermoplasmata archaeon]
MKKKILYINPVGTDIFDQQIKEILKKESQADTEIEVASLKKGPCHLEYYSYETLVLPDILYLIKRTEEEGYDAAIIGCFYDPGLREAREISEIVIVAPAEASMHIASTLGNKFSIIVGRKKWIPQMMDNVVRYGLKEKLASFKSVDLGVYNFHKSEKGTAEMLKKVSKEAIEKDGAEVIILGCTIQFGFFKELQDYLGAPVIDAVICPFKFAEFLVELKKRYKWGHSRVCEYEPPPIKEIKKWKLW